MHGAPPATGGPATATHGMAWMGAAVAGFVVGQVVSAVLLLVVAAVTGHAHDLTALASRPVPPGWIVVCGLVGLWFGFVGSVVWTSRRWGSGRLADDMGLRFEPIDLVLGPLVGAAGQFVVVPLLYLPFDRVIPNLSQKLSQPAKHLTGGFPGTDLVVIGVLTVAVVPVVEELVFRGLFLRGALAAFGRAGRRLGPALSVVVTGVVFGLAHVEALETFGLAAFGMVLAYVAYRTNRLGTCILAHATFNLVAIVAVATVAMPHL